MKLKDQFGKNIYSANLTPDKETGIGNYTLKDFNTTIKDGLAPGGKKLRSPISRFNYFTDKQINAIYTYINKLLVLK